MMMNNSSSSSSFSSRRQSASTMKKSTARSKVLKVKSYLDKQVRSLSLVHMWFQQGSRVQIFIYTSLITKYTDHYIGKSRAYITMGRTFGKSNRS